MNICVSSEKYKKSKMATQKRHFEPYRAWYHNSTYQKAPNLKFSCFFSVDCGKCKKNWKNWITLNTVSCGKCPIKLKKTKKTGLQLTLLRLIFSTLWQLIYLEHLINDMKYFFFKIFGDFLWMLTCQNNPKIIPLFP